MGPRMADEEERKLHVDNDDGKKKVTSRNSSSTTSEDDEVLDVDDGNGLQKFPRQHFHFGNYTRYLVCSTVLNEFINYVLNFSDNVFKHTLPFIGHVECIGIEFHCNLHVQI
jgi:hypothetical protein